MSREGRRRMGPSLSERRPLCVARMSQLTAVTTYLTPTVTAYGASSAARVRSTRTRSSVPSPVCSDPSTSPRSCTRATRSPRSYGTSTSSSTAGTRQPILDRRARTRSSPAPGPGGDEDRIRPQPLEPQQGLLVGGVGLVHDEQLRHLSRRRPRRAPRGPRGPAPPGRRGRRRRRARPGRPGRPPPASSGTPRPAGAAGAGRSRPCRRACRPGRRRSRDRRVVGSRVAKSASSTSTPAPVSRLSSDDLPALV